MPSDTQTLPLVLNRYTTKSAQKSYPMKVCMYEERGCSSQPTKFWVWDFASWPTLWLYMEVPYPEPIRHNDTWSWTASCFGFTRMNIYKKTAPLVLRLDELCPLQIKSDQDVMCFLYDFVWPSTALARIPKSTVCVGDASCHRLLGILQMFNQRAIQDSFSPKVSKSVSRCSKQNASWPCQSEVCAQSSMFRDFLTLRYPLSRGQRSIA